MNIQLNTYKININQKQIKVCIPIQCIENVYICPKEGYGNVIYGDEKGLYHFFLCTVYMHHYKECLMYIPIKPKKVLDLHKNWVESEHEYLSIVQAHQTIQLNIKDWKVIKESLKYKKAHIETFEIKNEGSFYEAFADQIAKRCFYHEFKDFIDLKICYKNIFLIGSSTSFGALAGDLWALIKEPMSNREQLAYYGIPHIHLDWLVRGKDTELCIDFYEESKM